MTLRPFSVALVALQVAALLYLAATGSWLATPRWIGLEILGIFLGAAAVLAVGFDRVRVLPELPRGARLVTRGPYRVVRHPMYAAVLLITLAVVLDQPSPDRVAVWALLLAVLLVKARYEEGLLRRRFPEYAAYQRRTKRLVPFLW